MTCDKLLLRGQIVRATTITKYVANTGMLYAASWGPQKPCDGLAGSSDRKKGSSAGGKYPRSCTTIPCESIDNSVKLDRMAAVVNTTAEANLKPPRRP